MDFSKTYFEIFQLPASFDVDLDDLASKYRRLQIEVHPDKFANATEQEKRLSLQWATQVNAAYDTLRAPLSRATYLIEMAGLDVEENPTVAPAFLMEQIELREQLEEIGEGNEGLTALDALRAAIKQRLDGLYLEFGATIGNSTEEARTQLYKLQFLDKLRREALQREEQLLDD